MSRVAYLLLYFYIASLIAPSAVAASLSASVTLCIVVNDARTAHVQHAKFAATFYASEYPQLAVQPKYIGTWETGGVSTPRGLVQAFAWNSSDCTLVVGPGSSALAIAINPLITTPWIEFGATVTELSSRASYPYFTRVIPNTAIATGSIGLALKQLGWTTINMLFTTSSYGLAAASAMTSSLAGTGTILRADSVSNDITVNDTVTLLEGYMRSPTSLLFVAISSADAAQATFITAAMAMNLTDHLVVFFSEGMCTAGNTWIKMRGSFCVAPQVNVANFNPFVQAYTTTRDVTQEIAELAALGIPPSKIDTTSTGSYQALAADATRFGLRALGRYVAQYGALSGGTTALVNAIANHVMPDGLTGAVSMLNTTGDRIGASFVILNAQPGLRAVPAFNVTAQGNVTLGSGVYLLANYRTLNSIPSLFGAPVSAQLQDTSTVITGATAACVVGLLLMGTLLVTLVPRWRAWKRQRTAPRDEGTPFTIVFTDIERSTALWAELPEMMGSLLDTHNAIIRQALEASEGYEVKTIGDSFMCAFSSAQAALDFAVAVQVGLHKGDFPPDVDDFYRDMMRELGTERPTDHPSLWHGLRVRVGMHTGTGSIVLDSVRGTYDYYGSVVNTAARIASMGHGGQILASETTMQAAGYRAAASADVVTMQQVSGSDVAGMAVGAVVLRGVPEPVPLFDIRPFQFTLRSFPAIRAALGDGPNDLEDMSQPSDDVEEGADLIRDVLKQIETVSAPKESSNTSRSEQSSTKRRRSTAAKGLIVLTESSAMEARERVRRVLAAKLKRGSTTGPHEATHRAAVAMELFLGLNAVLRVFPVERRARVLSDASAAWRIPRAAKTSEGEEQRDSEFLMLLAVKVVQVLGAARLLSTDVKHGSMSNDKLLDSSELDSTTDGAVSSFHLRVPNDVLGPTVLKNPGGDASPPL